MPWYLPWSESIKNRLSRYLLQRYLGQFLEEKLTLDQLTVDLYNGRGSVSDVRLDVQALNELGEQQNLPIEFVDGFISEVSVSIPWSSILRDGSYVEVSGLVITIQPKQRSESGTSMFESMWNSMTSSMQLAEECLKQEVAEGKEADQSQPLEGLELFAQTIDSILSRVKVKFVNTTLRLEHVPKDSSSGVAVELRIKNMDYFDEAGSDPPTPPEAADVELQQGNKMYQIAAFSTKKFYLEGVTLYTDEFPSRARTFSRSVMSVSTSSTPDSKNSSNFGTAPATPTSSSPTLDHLPSSRNTSHPSNLSLEPDPILFGRLSGRQEVQMKLRQSEGVIGPKVDLEVNLGSLTTFISPRQLHILVELVHGLATPDIEDTSNVPARSRCVEKPMDPSDFHRVEQELQQQLHPDVNFQNKGLQYTQGWSTASLDDSDDEFMPMRGTMSESVISNATSMDASTSSIGSSASSKSGSSYRPSPNVFTRQRKKSNKSIGATLDSDPTAEVSHFHVRVSSLAVVLLHEDILTLCVERQQDGTSLAHSSVQQMKTLAENFFAELGFFSVSGYGHKDFDQAKEIFVRACQLNHIRLLAAPVIVEGNEKTTAQASSISCMVSAASLELLECLIEKQTPTQAATVEYVELLRFMKNSMSENDPQSSIPLGTQPDVKLHFKYVEKAVNRRSSRRNTHPRTDISLNLQQCWSEIDMSIVDRITAVLNPQPLCRRSSFSSSVAKETFSQQCFYQAVETSALPETSTNIKVTSPYMVLKVRFPAPDLRPIHDMDRPPWWKRSVRKDVLDFELSDFTFQTLLQSRDSCQRYEIQCREIQGLFQEADTDKAVPFIQANADDRNGNSLPDGGQGFGWPRIVILVFPLNSPGELEEVPDRETDDPMRHSTTEAFESSRHKEPSPFSSKKVIHESDTPHGKSTNQDGEELVIPGDKAEMAEFIEHASRNSRVQLEINLPCASLLLSSKHLYELVYNRLSSDMLLWEPAAPKPKAASEIYGGNSQLGADLATALLQESLYPAFSMCKSGIQYDSDSDSEDNDGVYYSVYEHRQRHKRKQQQTDNSETGQSKVTFTVSINQGVILLHAPVRDAGGNVIPGQHGEIEIQLDEGNIFAVSGYKGKTGLGYVCVQVNRAAFYHAGLIANPLDNCVLKQTGCAPPTYLDPTIYRSEVGAVVNTSGSSNAVDMLSVAIKIQTDDETHHLKTFRVAIALRGATLRHRMCPSSNSWFTQLLDLFDVTDYPIPGYDPPGVLTELHLHLWDCAIDYRPLYIPLKTMITMGSFTVSSNIAAQTSSSTLRFIAEDASLFISDKTKNQNALVDLRKDYVCVLDLGLFELSLRLCDKTNGQNSSSPRVDLRASNNVLHIRTCSDSGKALTELLTYFASDGDLTSIDDQSSETTNSSISMDPILVNTESLDNNQNSANILSRSQTEHVHDLMEEAMKETNGAQKSKSQKSKRNKKGVEVFFFPDENHPLPTKPLAECEMSQGLDDDDDDDWEDDFCMVDKEAGSGIMSRNGHPEIRNLTQEPIRVVDNHFSVPMGKTDLLKAPNHYPDPVLRYTLREMTIVWHMYGGEDFASLQKPLPVKKHVKIEENSASVFEQRHYSLPSSPLGGGVTFSKSAPTEVRFKPQALPKPPQSPKVTTHSSQLSWQARGGPGRQHDVLMELQLNKVRFQHEVYPEHTVQAARQVLLINEVEIRDRLASSQINKFLYQYSSEAIPKQSHANMILIKAVHVRPDPKLRFQECCLKVSLLPLRLNIDQDSLLFLFAFFNDLSDVMKEDDEASQCHTKHNTPTHMPPVMTVNVGGAPNEPVSEPQTLLILLEDQVNPGSRQNSPVPSSEGLDERPPTFPIFFRSFIFSPEVPIRLDYQGKHVDMTHGPLAGLLMGLGQLNCSELRLKRLSYRHGLLGFDKLIAFVLAEWLNDIKKNQLPSLLGGVGPMHALVQLFQGIRDLFWLPIEQYQKDGRIVRGLQRGANSFTTSTAMAALELANRLVQAIQSTAEMAYDMVSPGPSVRRRSHGSKGRKRRYKQPADIREGMANAYMLVKEGLGETAQTIVRVASEEHDQKGVSGAVGGVLRQIPPTVVKPIILATEATSNLLGGMRSQLVPDARREAVEKWRHE